VAAENSGPPEFTENLKRYTDLRQRVTAGIPELKDRTDPAKIAAHEHSLAEAIRAARANAQPGDIFSPGVKDHFVQIVRSEIRGPEGTSVKKSIMADNPKKPGEPAKVDLAVNASYPKDAPLATTPPTLLLRLPTLPEGLEYRFVGKALILRDVNANLIVDFIFGVLP